MKTKLKYIILVFFASILILQNINIYFRIDKLKQNNRDLVEINNNQKENLKKIILSNTIQKPINRDVLFKDSDVIYLCVDYPICEACFKSVIYYLNNYVSEKNMQLMVLCNEPYSSLIRKKLKFEKLNMVQVDSYDRMEEHFKKMTLAFKSKSETIFFIPLPKNREIDFLKTYLN